MPSLLHESKTKQRLDTRTIRGGGKSKRYNKQNTFTKPRLVPTGLPYQKCLQLTNPEFIVEKVHHPTLNIELNLIDESHLLGGSKQRVICRYLADVIETEIVYAGPSTGFAQIALAYCCKLFGKHATVFADIRQPHRSSTPSPDQSPLGIAELLGAKIIYFEGHDTSKTDANHTSRLDKILANAERYCQQNPRRLLLPFGLNNKEIVDLYSVCFAPLATIIPTPPTRIWVVAGSAMIANTLHRIFPTSKLMIVQVGKTIWPDQLTDIDHELLISPYSFKEPTSTPPPYNSPPTYDGKLWEFVLKLGQPGDYIWNTAGRTPNPAKIIQHMRTIDTMLQDTRQSIKQLQSDMIGKPLPRYFAPAMPPPEVMFANLRSLVQSTPATDMIHANFIEQYWHSVGISNHFTEEARMFAISSRDREQLSPVHYWTKYKDEITVLAYYYGKLLDDGKIEPNWAEGIGKHGVSECSTFNPVILTNAIKFVNQSTHPDGRQVDFNTISVLDPSGGWGDRMLGACALGVGKYTCFDPNVDLLPGYTAIKEMFGQSTEITFNMEKFSAKNIPPNSFDMVVTSPPFYDQEIYRHTESDVKCSLSEWVDTIYEPYIRDSATCLRPGGHAAFYIENVKRTGNLADITTDLFKRYGLIKIACLQYTNSTKKTNGTIVTSPVRSCWIYRKPSTSTLGGGRLPTTVPTKDREYNRLLAVNSILSSAIEMTSRHGGNSEYETSNVVERFLLTMSNTSATDPTSPDPIFPDQLDFKSYIDDLRYKFPLLTDNDISTHTAQTSNTIMNYLANPTRIPAPNHTIKFAGNKATFSIQVEQGKYKRTITSSRMRLLLELANEDTLAIMLLRYACILSRAQHWAAPITYFRTLYKLGVRVECFASPINSVFILPEFKSANFCSLFPDTDKPYGSLGSFFNTITSENLVEKKITDIVIGPPYTEQLIQQIADRITTICTSGIPLRVYTTHSYWKWASGIKSLEQNKMLVFKHIFRARQHTYVTDKDVVVNAPFETVLFVHQSPEYPTNLTPANIGALEHLFG